MRGDVAEAVNPAGFRAVQEQGRGEALEGPAVLEEDRLEALVAGRAQLGDAGEEDLRVGDLVQHPVDEAVSVVALQDLLGKAPHGGEAAVPVGHLVVLVDHQDAVGGGFQGGAEQVLGLLQHGDLLLEVSGDLGHRVVTPFHAQGGADAGEQQLRLERLDDVVVGARVQPLDHLLRGGVDRQHDHRDAAEPQVVLQTAADFDAVHFRHEHVQEDHVGWAGIGRRQRLFSPRRHADLVPLRRKQLLHYCRLGRRILHHQHSDHGVSSASRTGTVPIFAAGHHRQRWSARKWDCPLRPHGK